MDSLFLPLAVIVTGLYGGFMLTFLVAIMPGLAALPDEGFTAAMRRFNEKVPGPLFLVLFLGVIVFPVVALFTEYGGRRWPLVAVAVACSVASHLVTIAGNIPLNKALAESEGGDDGAARTAFEAPWNARHRFRTGLSLAAFVLLAAAA
ncbi:anthrone oxygenase family protein [Streptomyces sp. NPDC005406]|uniref:anthrone oxygenase family protein n=1 Tax=Streptomyces sp. NPDC005406 TaxID=3155339 RepID=UPI003456EDA8